MRVILWKQLTRNDFNAINGRGAHASTGGGAMHSALGVNSRALPIRQFLRLVPGRVNATISAQGLVAPNLAGRLTLAGNPNRRGGEWVIADQYTHRHPAWSRQGGFPTRYSPKTPPILVLARNGRYFYAGFLLKRNLARLPSELRLAIQGASKGILEVSPSALLELRNEAPTPLVGYYQRLSRGQTGRGGGRGTGSAGISGGLKRVVAEIVRRQGQGRFRTALLAAYQGQCAITGEGVEDVLEAAHIIPFARATSHSVANGLLLRADWHVLFDLGLVSVKPGTWRILVSRILDGTTYAKKRGRRLRLPLNHSDWPSVRSVRNHRLSFTP